MIHPAHERPQAPALVVGRPRTETVRAQRILKKLAELESVTDRMAAAVAQDDVADVLNAAAYLMVISARAQQVTEDQLIGKVRAMFRESKPVVPS